MNNSIPSAFSMYNQNGADITKSDSKKLKNRKRRLAKRKKHMMTNGKGEDETLTTDTKKIKFDKPIKNTLQMPASKLFSKSNVSDVNHLIHRQSTELETELPKLKNIPLVSVSSTVRSKSSKEKTKLESQTTKRKAKNKDGLEIKSSKKVCTREEIVQDSSSDFDMSEFEPILTDSVEEGKNLFSWLLSPVNVDTFFSETWEKIPLHIKRKKANYYKNIISTPIIDELLRTENIMFTKNIDITSYSNEKRETHNPVGRALPHVVWDFYLNGCSVRLLNPQTYIPRLHLLNATLQEYFKCFVGANSYLTPPSTQGFAPHYDDIEAFILQIEGRKLWRIYAPITDEDVLPRVSSKNFDQAEIGDPILEVTLEAGDLLYFPRGFIHQGVTIKEEHSLHVTLSCYQKQSWADLFEKLLPLTLETAIKEDKEFRKGLPMDIFDNFGLVHSDSDTPKRTELMKHMKKLFNKLANHFTCDDAVDQVATKFMHDALPPVLTEQEKQLTVFGDSDKMVKNGVVKNRVEVQLDTKIRLVRANIIRMVMEDGLIRIYYYVENSKEYHGNEPQYLEIEDHMAPGIETLITTYPEYVSVEQLNCKDDMDKVTIASDLWERGIIMTESPLDYIE